LPRRLRHLARPRASPAGGRGAVTAALSATGRLRTGGALREGRREMSGGGRAARETERVRGGSADGVRRGDVGNAREGRRPTLHRGDGDGGVSRPGSVAGRPSSSPGP